MAKELEVIWSPEADRSFEIVIAQILKRWTLTEAIEFDNKAMSLINTLTTQHKLCPPSKKKKIR